MNEEKTEKSPALREQWFIGETIDDKGIYKKLRFRKIEQLAFYIRPLREWFFPCIHCQLELKKMFAEGKWILGNKDYKPDIELNNTKNEIDDDSWETLEGPRKATKEELERIGLEGWEDVEE